MIIMHRKERIMIDLDDVICGEGFIFLINEYLGTNFRENDSTEFMLQNMVQVDKRKDCLKYVLDNNLYNYVKIKEEAVRVIEKLNNRYDVYICSSYIIKEMGIENKVLPMQKFEWILNNLPFLTPSQIIFANNKQLLDMDVRIDDGIWNLNGNCRSLLFTAYHNKNITDEELNTKSVIRVNSWIEIEKILL